MGECYTNYQGGWYQARSVCEGGGGGRSVEVDTAACVSGEEELSLEDSLIEFLLVSFPLAVRNCG